MGPDHGVGGATRLALATRIGLGAYAKWMVQTLATSACVMSCPIWEQVMNRDAGWQSPKRFGSVGGLVIVVLVLSAITQITVAPAGAALPKSQAIVTQSQTAMQASESVSDQPQPDSHQAIQTTVGWLELSGEMRDTPIPYAWVDGEDAKQTLKGVLGQLQTVAEGKQYRGVVIYLDQVSMSLAQIHAITSAMEAVRASGKRVLTFAAAYDTREYLLASAADLILLQHKGSIDLMGMSVEELYVAGLLEKIGVKADMLQIGKYKGAAEAITSTGPSEAWNENFDSLLTDLYDQVITRLADGRNMSRDEIEAIIRDSWTMTDTQYIRRRVVDRLVARDLVDVTEIEFGDSFTWDDTMGLPSQHVQAVSPFAMFQMLFQEQSHVTHRPTIAVVHANGPIISGDSSFGDGIFTEDSIGSRTFNQVCGEVVDDENIKGVIFRIDSPGGSALASEIIWQAIRNLSETKPVFVSIGSIAASGGYYIASAGNEIYVGPQSIVGSIGAVSGKLVMGGLYDMVGINIHRRHRGPLGDLFNSVEPFTEAQREVIQGSLDKIYEQFTQRVVLGRGNRLPDIAQVDEGMLFTGRQAVANGMADKIGIASDAIVDLAEQLGLEPGKYDVIDLPQPLSFQEWLSEIFSIRVPSTIRSHVVVDTAHRLLGDEAWRSAAHVLEGIMLLRKERILLLMPRVVVVR